MPKGFTVLATLDVTGSMRVPHYAGYISADRPETTKTFTVLDVVVDHTFNLGKNDRVKMRTYLRAANLLDDFQPDLDRGRLRDSSYFYGPIYMREAIVGVTFSFRKTGKGECPLGGCGGRWRARAAALASKPCSGTQPDRPCRAPIVSRR
ncbi:MAG: hypothetical protein ACP5U2_17195 [Bryobacteraceae bacterium]